MDFSKLMVGGAVFGAVAASWGYIKSFFWKFCQLFIQRIEVGSDDCADALISYLVKHYKHSRLYDRVYGHQSVYLRTKDGTHYGKVAFEIFGKYSMMFWNGKVPFYFHGKSSSPKDSNGNTASSGVAATMIFIRGTLNADDIVCNAMNERNDIDWASWKDTSQHQRRFFIKYIPDISKDEKSETAVNTYSWWFKTSKYKLLNYTPDQIGPARSDGKSMLDQLVFPDRIKELIEEVKVWRHSREWYEERGIPWKRGWLLYGPPGTGKTILARSFAEDLDMPVFVFNLAEIFNHELIRSWLSMQAHTPCIALIEDIDNVFDGRRNVAQRDMWTMFGRGDIDKDPDAKADKDGDDDDDNNKSKKKKHGPGYSSHFLNFDIFINCLDGVGRAEGVFTIITTNHIDKIDPALGKPSKLADGTMEFISTRPGRIDKAIELTYMEPRDKRIMARRILKGYPDGLKEIMAYVDVTDDVQETPAQFQERCCQIALKCYWKLTREQSNGQIKKSVVAQEIPRAGRQQAKIIDGL